MNATPYVPTGTRVVEYTYHAISPVELFIVIVSFIIMSYYYIKIRKYKERYIEWVNPSGRVINLYTLITRLYWVYVATIIILGIIQIIIFPGV